MRTTLRQAREGTGVSVEELAGRLGITPEAAESLELMDEQGTAESGTVDRALGALGLARWDAVLEKDDLDAIMSEARDLADRAAGSIGGFGQAASQTQIDEIVTVLVARKVAFHDATAHLLGSRVNADRLLDSIRDLGRPRLDPM